MKHLRLPPSFKTGFFPAVIGLILLSLFLSFESSLAQLHSDQKTNLKFDRIYEGLASSRVSVITQDKFGFIWVGSHSGLHKYDGINFKIYTDNGESNSILNNFIVDILEDRDGVLWVGSVGGLSRYNRETDDFTRYSFYGSNQNNVETTGSVNGITEDRDGVIWVSGGDESLYRVDQDAGVLMPVGDFSNFGINVIDEGDDHTIWMSTTYEGIVQYSTKENRIIRQIKHDPLDPTSISTNNIRTILVDQNGVIWAGTFGFGLYSFNVSEEIPNIKNYRHQPNNPNSLGNNHVFSLYEDNDGQLWVGNENGGLHLYNRSDDSFHRYYNDPRNPDSITDDSIWSVYQDRDGRIWVGTAQTGINIADPYAEKFTNYNMSLARDGIQSHVIRDIIEDHEGVIWLATDGGGLSRFDRQSGLFHAYRDDPNDSTSISSDATIHLNIDDQNRIWVGSYRGGLDVLIDRDEGHFVSFKELINNDNYRIENVFSIHFDKLYDYIWIGSFDETLLRYDRNTNELRPISLPNGNTATTFVISMFEDSRHNIWISTLEGLIKIPTNDRDGETGRHYVTHSDDVHSLRSNTIHQVMEDSNQQIWIATSEGLSKYIEESERFVTYDRSDGLPANDIRSIVEDDNGHLWIGTNRGLSHFDPVQFTFKNYFRFDGLQGDEFSRYSVHKTRNGELIFGGMNGFNIFHPENVLENPNAPPIYLTDFRLLNRSVEIGGEDSPLSRHISVTDTLTLLYDQNIFTFEFIALNYTQTENNQYAYMMEGLESEWNYVGNQTNATYTNLFPGEYLFRVKASNNDGVWNEEGTSLVLIITPPFWQTTWFYLLVLIAVGFIVVFVYRLRVQNIQERNKKLELEVTERTNQLKAKNVTLETTLKELESTKDELIQQAHKAGMADIASGVLHNVGNILASINTSAALIEDIVQRSKIDGFVQANRLLKENIDHIDEFISKDPKGKGLLDYYLKLEKPITTERERILQQTERLIEKIKLVNDVISAQQNYAGIGLLSEEIFLSEIIDSALALESGSIERHSLNVKTDYRATDPVNVHQTKLIHVLVNIFKNAKEAMSDNEQNDKNIEIKTWQEGDQIYLSITDNGTGIRNENLNKIFTQGFTTKVSGHGFGLHSSANYMREMGGSIRVESGGAGKGATFTLTFPGKPVKKKEQKSKKQLDIN
ncbi:MAG: two-component regulator propeller domain-containing protein [Balneolaceae bacterium]